MFPGFSIWPGILLSEKISNLSADVLNPKLSISYFKKIING